MKYSIITGYDLRFCVVLIPFTTSNSQLWEQVLVVKHYSCFIQEQIHACGDFLAILGAWVEKVYCLNLWKTINSIITTVNLKDRHFKSIKAVYFIALKILVFITTIINKHAADMNASRHQQNNIMLGYILCQNLFSI